MSKRPRADDDPDNREVVKVGFLNDCDSEDTREMPGQPKRRFLDVLKEIMPPSQPVKFVEQSLNPLGVSPVSDYRDLIDRQELLDLTKGIQMADDQVKFKLLNELAMINAHSLFIRDQTARIVKEAAVNFSLNQIPCNFRKVPGNTYYVYKKPSGQNYFSMLSPKDWGEKLPHEYCGSYVYQYDHTWSRASEQFSHLLQGSLPTHIPKVMA